MPQLDALRAVAVGVVVYSHWMPESMQLGLDIGPAGVQLFFVLSGFLITDILLRCRGEVAAGRGSAVLKAFYLRRALRIFPAYWLILGLVYWLDLPSVRSSFTWHLLYLSNLFFFFRGAWGATTSHLWSLAVEEQFYIFWPFLILLLPSKKLGAVISLAILAAVGGRGVIASQVADPSLAKLAPFASIDALGMGALIALAGAKNWAKAPWTPWLFGGGIVAVLLARFLPPGMLPMWGCSELRSVGATAISSALVPWAAVGLPGFGGTMARHAVPRSIGKVSYMIYLVHHFVPEIVTMINVRYPWIPFLQGGRTTQLAWLALTLGFAYLSWFCFEGPINSLKRRFPYGESRSAA